MQVKAAILSPWVEELIAWRPLVTVRHRVNTVDITHQPASTIPNAKAPYVLVECVLSEKSLADIENDPDVEIVWTEATRNARDNSKRTRVAAKLKDLPVNFGLVDSNDKLAVAVSIALQSQPVKEARK